MHAPLKATLVSAMALAVSACTDDVLMPPNAYCTFDETSRTAKIIYTPQLEKKALEVITIKNLKILPSGNYQANQKDITVNQEIASISKESIYNVSIIREKDNKYRCYINNLRSQDLSYPLKSESPVKTLVPVPDSTP